MHPIILPNKSKVTEFIVKRYHLKAAPCGKRQRFLNYQWKFHEKSVVSICVTCCKLRGKMGVQIMADLPKGRFEEAAPFTYCAVDMLKQFKVKVKRNEV